MRAISEDVLRYASRHGTGVESDVIKVTYSFTFCDRIPSPASFVESQSLGGDVSTPKELLEGVQAMEQGVLGTRSMGLGDVGLEVLSNLEGMARTKNTVSREETGAEQLKGVRGGRRAQTASYRKSKELGRGKGANEVGDLPNEASASPPRKRLARSWPYVRAKLMQLNDQRPTQLRRVRKKPPNKANKKEAINLHLSHLK
ncbi:hypothetical protein Scep_001494 [Stephania cephalantha]|uniref:Uncharacterized protein n=1 Tax=Stephania cephalantha TaxID=152367 RepID=A0AAP0L846_9MAGN